MKVDTKEINPALKSLFDDPGIIVFLDANIFIPPDRSDWSVKPYRFEQYKEIWLEPLLNEFSGLALHESVYEELVAASVKNYVDEQAKKEPPLLRIYRDVDLSEPEKAMMNTYIRKLAVHSLYDPGLDNSKDRGEVRSLSYMAVKEFLYFSAHDSLPIKLVKDADRLNTGLDNMSVVQLYELIYYLYQTEKYDNKGLRSLCKYLYFLTKNEKKTNPEWGIFVQEMNALYGRVFFASPFCKKGGRG